MGSLKVIEENRRSTTTQEGFCGCGCETEPARNASADTQEGARPTRSIKALYHRALSKLRGPCGCDGSCGCGVARK